MKLFSAPDAALVLNKLHTQRPWLGERGGKHHRCCEMFTTGVAKVASGAVTYHAALPDQEYQKSPAFLISHMGITCVLR